MRAGRTDAAALLSGRLHRERVGCRGAVDLDAEVEGHERAVASVAAQGGSTHAEGRASPSLVVSVGACAMLTALAAAEAIGTARCWRMKASCERRTPCGESSELSESWPALTDE